MDPEKTMHPQVSWRPSRLLGWRPTLCFSGALSPCQSSRDQPQSPGPGQSPKLKAIEPLDHPWIMVEISLASNKKNTCIFTYRIPANSPRPARLSIENRQLHPHILIVPSANVVFSNQANSGNALGSPLRRMGSVCQHN